MANLNLNLDAPTGWNRWIYAKSVVGNIQIPDASFPRLYTPSAGFWGRSIISHCLIPWLNTPGAFSAFVLGGGGTGTILGAATGLAVVSQLFEISVHGQIFGIGRGAEPPQMGFCIGNKFKQQVYTRMDVQNDGLGKTITTNIGVDLLQNSRFKRVYIDHGSVVRYTNTASITSSASIEHLLTLDINKTTSLPFGFDLSGSTITITTAASTTIASSDMTLKVLGIKNNWDFIISAPPSDINPDDYYKLSPVLCIEDPYLLSGFWVGSENTANPPISSSGLDLYITSHNSPYEEGKFLGTYIWQTDPTAAESANGASSSVVSQQMSGSSMDDSSGFTWAFFGFGNSPEYEIYPNDIRYREINLDVPNDDGSIIERKDRLASTLPNYQLLLNSEPDYVRVEIGTGGYLSRHNWFAPCLKGEYIKIKSTEKIHKILNHIEFNIIDVAYWDIKKQSIFDPNTNQAYSIVNQSAWFINEHYDGRVDRHDNTGIFKGSITANTNNNTFVIQTLGDTFISTLKKNGLSFIDRYQKNISLSSTLKKMFSKFDGWQLVNYNGKAYDIKSVDFSSAVSRQMISYPITVVLKDSANDADFATGTNAYITFDKSYNVYGNASKENGYSYMVDVKAGLEGSPGYYIISNVLCLDGEFFTNPYKIDISSNDRIGFCEGYLFGMAANGSAQSNYNQLMLFTVPRLARGISSLFHYLRSEDWVVYQDIVTGKITIRRGSLDFTEYPMKSMIVIGQPEERVSLGSSNPIVLNESYDMIRRMGITFSSSTSGSDIAFLFGIGNKNNIYGFYISGQGIVNLSFLTRSGILPGTISSDTYTGEGYSVSPIYVYTPNYYQNVKTDIVDVGIKTTDGPIYIQGGNVSDVWGEYISEKQTLSDIGYYDLVGLPDGEKLFIYGYQPKGFKLGSNAGSITTTSMINNSRENSTLWSNQNAAMIIGTSDDSFLWGSPIVDRIDDANNLNRYPLMILNSVDYLACIYNPLNETLSLFCRCETKASGQNRTYLGCLIKSIVNLLHESFYCESYPLTDSSPFSFRWSPPLLPDSFIDNESKSWTDKGNLINDGYSFDPEKDNSTQDNFIRVMGSIATGSQVQNPDEFGIISTYMLPDGTYIVFYDSAMGIKALFSSSSGYNWRTTHAIYARSGKSALLVNTLLFYISSEGIEVKHTNITDFYLAKDIAAGIVNISAEIDLQETLDEEDVSLIGSGTIELQRLSGYITPEGITKIFFYDNRSLLKCMESSDSYSWTVTNNF